MIIHDAWGTEFHSKEEAETCWRKMFWDDYIDEIEFANHFDLSDEIAHWIFTQHFNEFKTLFSKDIEAWENEWIENCWFETDEIIEDE